MLCRVILIKTDPRHLGNNAAKKRFHDGKVHIDVVFILDP